MRDLKFLKLNKSASSWPVYQDGLLMSALFLCLQDILSQGAPSSWSLALIFGSFYYWSHCRNSYELVRRTREFKFSFLATTCCFFGMSFENGNFVYLSLGAIPILVGLGESETKGPRNLFLMASLMGLTILMALASERIQLTSLDVMLLFSVFVMGLGPMTSKTTDTESDLATLSEEKIFFHDLVGEVHGINLYLASFKEEEKLAPREMKVMMKSLSLMIEGHYRNRYGISHRHLNISQRYDLVECFEELKYVVKSYLGAAHIKIHYTYKGMIENQDSWQHLKLNKTNFRRLMVNICKNIAESGSNHVEFVFDGDTHGLYFEVKNNLTGLSSSTKDLDAHLGAVISNADKEAPLELRGLGLMSMAQNCEEFQFRFEGQCWITSGRLLWEAEESSASLRIAS